MRSTGINYRITGIQICLNLSNDPKRNRLALAAAPSAQAISCVDTAASCGNQRRIPMVFLTRHRNLRNISKKNAQKVDMTTISLYLFFLFDDCY